MARIVKNQKRKFQAGKRGTRKPNMTDFIDRACENEERFREQALAQFRQPENNEPSATHCEECGDPIPEARQRIVSGCRLCVICQTLKEING